MASVMEEVIIEAPADEIWRAIRDFDAGPVRMAPGFVVDSRLEGDVRVVGFADGSVARERFIAIDEDARRIVHSIIGGNLHPCTTTVRCRCSPTARTAAGSSGFTTCYRTN